MRHDDGLQGTLYRLGAAGLSTGKTTFLSKQVAEIVRKDRRGYSGPTRSPAVVCSLTRAAAAEIAGRDLPIPREAVGTLHAHAYRIIGRPPVAESLLDDWNLDHPNCPMTVDESKSKKTLDEPGWDTRRNQAGDEGDLLLSDLNLARARMQPVESWSATLRGFSVEWRRWKRKHGCIDFTDMIEMALHDYGGVSPMGADVIVADESQDHSALEYSLLKAWGDAAGALIMAGDPWQALYVWRGAHPESFRDPAVAEDHRRVLSQSYRVPRAVHARAMEWAKNLSTWQPLDYRPRDADGLVKRLPDEKASDPTTVVRMAIERAEGGKTVMIAASCSYHLGPILASLRAAGIPFANPWRTRRGDWNPMGNRRGTSMAARLLEFIRPDVPTYGQEARLWTLDELADWTEVLAAEGLLRRGAKSGIEAAAKEAPGQVVEPEHMAGWFEPGAMDGVMRLFASRDPEGDATRPADMGQIAGWWSARVLRAREAAARYPAKVLAVRGPQALTDPPRIFVGTIHSFKGGEADCSPPDERVLTTNRGWVAIGELDPVADRLVSFNSDHHKIHRSGPRRPNGYAFTKAEREHVGRLLTITTEASRTRVTPNHHLTVRWNARAMKAVAVYLMRRGNWWRIGISAMKHKSGSANGITQRLGQEQGEEAWIIRLFDSRKEALYYESLWSWKYSIPQLPFEQVGRNPTQMNSEDLHRIFSSIETHSGALRLLADHQLSEVWPSWRKAEEGKIRRRQTGLRNRWLIRAANLMPGFMEIPTDPGKGQEPLWLPFTIIDGWYAGKVYSLDVERWHHYVSGGAIVHNCVFLYPDLSPAGFQQWQALGEPRDSVVRLFYVGMTRAREELFLCGDSTGISVDWQHTTRR